MMDQEIVKNHSKIKEDIIKACESCNRNPNTVNLTAICKRQPIDKVTDAMKLGISNFGENRIQDAQLRWLQLERKKTKLNFVGPLQSNKAEEAVKLFDSIETVDRDKIAKHLSVSENKLARKIEYMIQVNTGEEKQKSGILPMEADDFIQRCQKHHGLNIVGLMCIPPAKENPALHFAFLKELSKRNSLKFLSMGMSNDFKIAIEFGSTHVRIGTKLFGERLIK